MLGACEYASGSVAVVSQLHRASLWSASCAADVLLIVFMYLGARDLASCSRICMLWCDVSRDKSLWRRLNARWEIPPSTANIAQKHPRDYFCSRILDDVAVMQLMKQFEQSDLLKNLPLIESCELIRTTVADLLKYKLGSPATPWYQKYIARMCLRRAHSQWILKKWHEVETKLSPEYGACLITALRFIHLDPQSQVIDPVHEELDRIVAGFSCPPQITGKERLIKLLEYFYITLGFRGNVQCYMSIENSYIHTVLSKRTGIPVTLALVLHSIGARLSPPMQIEMTGFPQHLLARYYDHEQQQPIYIDPFYTDSHAGEVRSLLKTPHECEALLAQLGVPFSPDFLAPITTGQVLLRILRNIYHAITVAMREGGTRTLLHLLYTVVVLHLRLDSGVSNWSMRQLRLRLLEEDDNWIDHGDIEEELHRLKKEGDAHLTYHPNFQSLCKAAEKLRLEHATPQQTVFHREILLDGPLSIEDMKEDFTIIPQFKIGTLFRHRTQEYVAFIYGWDRICKNTAQWQRTMGVDALEFGANQPFYTCRILSDDVAAVRYVAQENIIPIQTDEGWTRLLTIIPPPVNSNYADWMDTIAGLTDIPSTERSGAASEIYNPRYGKWKLVDIGEESASSTSAAVLGQWFDSIDHSTGLFIPNSHLRRKYPDN